MEVPIEIVVMFASAISAMALFIVGLLRWVAKTLIEREKAALSIVVNNTDVIAGFKEFLQQRIK